MYYIHIIEHVHKRVNNTFLSIKIGSVYAFSTKKAAHIVYFLISVLKIKPNMCRNVHIVVHMSINITKNLCVDKIYIILLFFIKYYVYYAGCLTERKEFSFQTFWENILENLILIVN